MAEAHPVGFQWVIEAKLRGAKVIHVDPRFTRTSALADTFVPIRAGTDIAFLGGVINHVLSNDLDFREYVVAYTNAATVVGERFADTEDLDGLFSGFDPATRTYDESSWQYAGHEADGGGAEETEARRGAASALQHESHGPGVSSDVERDETLQHPRCVFQILKRHFARYTPEMVQRVCGVSAEQLQEVADAWVAGSGRERTTTLVYSVGWTQHSTGVQYIRTGAILQLLLGNMGRPGGGILALRGHASIQGSTDIPTLFNLLPGYLPMPHVAQHERFDDWIGAIRHGDQKGFWGGAPAYATSLLKAWWGDAATADNDFAYGYLPRISGDHGTYRQVLDMIDGKIQGYFLLGQNPAVGSAHGKAQRLGMANLDWLVCATCSRSRVPPSGGTGPRWPPARSCPRRAAPRCSCCRPRRMWRRRARSPRPSGCCSGGRRRWSHPATVAPSCGSSSTWVAWRASGWPARPTGATGRSST